MLKCYPMFLLQKKTQRFVTCLLLFIVTGLWAVAEGTPQVMPNSANGVGLSVANGSFNGPYRGAPTQNRIRFYINNNATENLYFSIKAYDRAGTPAQIPVYYRIINAAGTEIVAPALITTAQQINTYAQALAGPNIGGAVPAGYTPLVFDPTANGEYSIELYLSTDAGATATANQNTAITLFDFTVATAANVKLPGRVYCQAWSFITYNPANNVAQIDNSLESDFYGYTADSSVVKVDLQTGFRPFGFIIYMNKYGAVNGTDWPNNRKSQNTGGVSPSLPNGYPVFLNVPDAAIFPVSTVVTTPQFAGKIYGCAPNLYITFTTSNIGDVAILLDINGTAGFQAGTSDRYLYFYDVAPGRNVVTWNGLDGLGNTVSSAATFNMTVSLRRGRTNVPMYDAELNSNGMSVSGISPLATTPRMFFDDLLIANTATTTCGTTADNANNNTGTGISNTDVGLTSPGRAWDGPGSGNATPAPTGGTGSTTLILNCDDYGNVRTLNTWFWAYEVSSAIFSASVPACSADGDAVPYTTDADDDNDGITDLVESGGTDPTADADSDGIPNFLDPVPGGGPAFTDSNNDGVNDAYDADKDGVINSFDLDSDNDGIFDIIEAGGTDANGDGRADATTDVDGDGLIDTYDATCSAGVVTCLSFTAGTTIANTDTDGDGIPNARDLDSDNDGITDLVEAGGVDTNGDGRIDGAFADADNDGLHDTYDASTGGDAIQYRDNDGDGIPNTSDLDSDNDGIPDVVEAGGTDANNDGRIDGFTDTDGDGLSQNVDGDANNDGTAENTADALIITGTDSDSDGDPDSYPRANADAVGLPNPYDLDSDGDGILDVREAGIIDADNNGLADGTLSADGWSSSVDAQGTLIIRNTSSLGSPDYLDIDSDEDGIPDNIEAQTTAGYLAPAGADSDNDGIDNNYDNNDAAFAGNANNGLTPVNTDNGDMPDYLDTDSDNDGKTDSIEGWDTNGNGVINGSEIAFAGITDSDGDGLYNEYDNDDANANPTNGTTPASYPDVNNPGGDRDWRQTIDTDADGVPDITDVDDDNDGILDINECAGCTTDVFTNGSFETPAAPANSFQYSTAVPGWSTTASDNNIELWATGYNGVPAAAGNTFAEINATQVSTLYQSFCLNGSGATISWSFKHRGRLGIDAADFKIGSSLATATLQASAADGTTAWGSYSGIYTAPIGVNNLVFAFTAVSTSSGNGSLGNFLDDIQITITENCDIDGDGIINRLDLDSDNDGITDLVEAGGIDTNGDGRIDGTFADTDGDGLHNTYDASTGGANIANLDTDGDGIPNMRDTDSDNDGIPDVVEAGGTDANNDGKIDGFTDTDNDGLAQSVDGDNNNDGTAESTANALIITSTAGATPGRPASYPRANQDANGLPNPYDLDSDGDGILDVREAGLTDTNNDGVADGTLGTDGWSDTIDALTTLTPTNTDGRGRANYLDIDSDDDGIVDNIEAQTTAGYLAPAGADADGDGIDDNYDNNDAAFAGNTNNGLTPVNSDAVDLVDYLDLDSDNDGYPDSFEGHDTDGDQLPDAGSNANNGVSGGLTDADNDGLPDGYDNNTASPDPTNGTIPVSYPNIDGGTSERDWREVANTDNTGGGNTTDIDDDNDGTPDITECGGFDPIGDADGDGIRNYLDPTPGTGLPAFTDANGDGINDAYDADQDGIINSLDLDSDNDGIADLVEAGGVDTNGDGRVDNTTDTDGDGLADPYDTSNGGVNIANLDTDGDGIPNSRDTDSDGDGIPDVVEAGGTDANNDGKIDGFTDADGDGFAQSVDGDANNDGTAENTAAALIITGTDGNADGRPDTYPRANADANGLPNPYDLDSDGDGILDVREAGLTDTNNDGMADGTLGADGWSDTVDALAALNLRNTDGTGRADYLDLDSDDDGIVDIIEAQTTAGYLAPSGTDTDGDGIDNNYDNNNAAFGGNANNGITPTNTDGADNPDYRDTDSDNDGRSDRLEGWDTNGNGVIDGAEITFTGTTDSDNDGLYNEYDNDDVNPIATNGTTPASYPDVVSPGGDRDWRQTSDADNDGVPDNVDADDDNDGITDAVEGGGDTDGDGIPDNRDLDSDNDGIPDIVEAGGIDTNGDGRVDGVFADTDADGLANLYDASTGGVNIANLDTDGDGIPNSRDTDSDNDGIPDVVEAGGTDANNDGKIDGFTDNDNDGLAQSVDGDNNNDGTAESTASALIITSTAGATPGRPASYPRANADANGLPNPYDLDSDGDGILDVREAGLTDTNNDGVADGTLGTDGWSDTVDALAALNLLNTDGDGRPNYLDIDADNDGITDNVEAQSSAGFVLPSGTDSDGDGIDNTYDNNNAAFAGNANNGLTPYNHDGTDQPDYLDTDSDNDGNLDRREGNDWNGNRLPDENTVASGVDTDGDGLDDIFDLVNGPNGTIVGYGGTGSRATAQRTPTGASDRDWRNQSFSLPVTLISFGAEGNNNLVYVRWTAENEINFKEYVVERSTNGVDFVTAGTVAPQNGSSRHSYQLADPVQAISSTAIYYRLKMIDLDGNYKYSSIARVSRNGALQKAITVTPNPVTEAMQIRISSDVAATAGIQIIAAGGQVLYKTKQAIYKGDNIIPVQHLPAMLAKGIYMLTVLIDGQQLNTRFVVE